MQNSQPISSSRYYHRESRDPARSVDLQAWLLSSAMHCLPYSANLEVHLQCYCMRMALVLPGLHPSLQKKGEKKHHQSLLQFSTVILPQPPSTTQY